MPCLSASRSSIIAADRIIPAGSALPCPMMSSAVAVAGLEHRRRGRRYPPTAPCHAAEQSGGHPGEISPTYLPDHHDLIEISGSAQAPRRRAGVEMSLPPLVRPSKPGCSRCRQIEHRPEGRRLFGQLSTRGSFAATAAARRPARRSASAQRYRRQCHPCRPSRSTASRHALAAGDETHHRANRPRPSSRAGRDAGTGIGRRGHGLGALDQPQRGAAPSCRHSRRRNRSPANPASGTCSRRRQDRARTAAAEQDASASRLFAPPHRASPARRPPRDLSWPWSPAAPPRSEAKRLRQSPISSRFPAAQIAVANAGAMTFRTVFPSPASTAIWSGVVGGHGSFLANSSFRRTHGMRSPCGVSTARPTSRPPQIYHPPTVSCPMVRAGKGRNLRLREATFAKIFRAMFAQSCRTPSSADRGARHAKRQVQHPERAAVVRHFG